MNWEHAKNGLLNKLKNNNHSSVKPSKISTDPISRKGWMRGGYEGFGVFVKQRCYSLHCIATEEGALQL